MYYSTSSTETNDYLEYISHRLTDCVNVTSCSDRPCTTKNSKPTAYTIIDVCISISERLGDRQVHGFRNRARPVIELGSALRMEGNPKPQRRPNSKIRIAIGPIGIAMPYPDFSRDYFGTVVFWILKVLLVNSAALC